MAEPTPKRDSHAVEVTLKNLTKSYGDFLKPLDDISLTIGRGEFLTLLGPSGCGKSTTMRCVAGLETPTSGDILFDDVRINDVPVYKRNVGFVFQNWALFPHLTVAENVAFGLRLRRVSKADRLRLIEESLETVQMAGFMDRKPSQLSGGQQQRVALARALVIQPQMLMFDEPLSNLDAKLRKEMRSELKRLHDLLGRTTIYVTHDQEEALTLSDRIALLYKGRIQQIGDPIEIYNRPANAFVAEFMGFENLIPGKVSGIDGSAIRIDSGFGPIVVEDADRAPQYATGDGIQALVRANTVKLSESSDGTIGGTISQFLYYGDTTTYMVSLADGAEPIQCVEQGVPRFHGGESVRVALDPAAMVPVPLEAASV
ncbi:MAG: ABC transporter ATP-binding protein [Pseudomonadota bacterium]